MNKFQPHAGQEYINQYNDRIKVLVVTPIKPHANGCGWLTLALPIYPNGSYGRVMMVSVQPRDTLYKSGRRLPAVAVEALKRHRSIQRKARAAYVNDDSCHRDGDFYLWGV